VVEGTINFMPTSSGNGNKCTDGGGESEYDEDANSTVDGTNTTTPFADATVFTPHATGRPPRFTPSAKKKAPSTPFTPGVTQRLSLSDLNLSHESAFNTSGQATDECGESDSRGGSAADDSEWDPTTTSRIESGEEDSAWDPISTSRIEPNADQSNDDTLFEDDASDADGDMTLGGDLSLGNDFSTGSVCNSHISETEIAFPSATSDTDVETSEPSQHFSITDVRTVFVCDLLFVEGVSSPLFIGGDDRCFMSCRHRVYSCLHKE